MTSSKRVRRPETNPFGVAVGQHWMDNDLRARARVNSGWRFVEVVAIEGAYAVARSYRTMLTADRKIHRMYGRTSRIRLDRFCRKNGYQRAPW